MNTIQDPKTIRPTVGDIYSHKTIIVPSLVLAGLLLEVEVTARE